MKAEIVAGYCEELRSLLCGGMALGQAVELLAEEAGASGPERVVAQRVVSGSSLAEGMAYAFSPLPEWIRHVISVTEEAAAADHGLDLVVGQLREEIVWRDDLLRSLAYPLVLLAATTLVGLILAVVILPSLSAMTEELGAALPLASRFALTMGAFAASPGGFLVWLAIFSTSAWLYAGRARAPDFLARMPWIRNALMLSETWRYFRIAGVLLAADLPLHRALRQAAGAVRPLAWRAEARRLAERVEAGEAAALAVRAVGWLPSRTARVLSVAASSGSMAQGVENLAQWAAARRRAILKTWATWLPVVLLGVSAVMIGFLAQAVLLPAFQIDVIP